LYLTLKALITGGQTVEIDATSDYQLIAITNENGETLEFCLAACLSLLDQAATKNSIQITDSRGKKWSLFRVKADGNNTRHLILVDGIIFNDHPHTQIDTNASMSAEPDNSYHGQLPRLTNQIGAAQHVLVTGQYKFDKVVDSD